MKLKLYAFSGCRTVCLSRWVMAGYHAEVEVGGRAYYYECYEGTGLWSRAVSRHRKPTHTFVYKTRLRRGEFGKILVGLNLEWPRRRLLHPPPQLHRLQRSILPGVGCWPVPFLGFHPAASAGRSRRGLEAALRQGLDRPRSKCTGTSTPPTPLDPSHVREGGLRRL